MGSSMWADLEVSGLHYKTSQVVAMSRGRTVIATPMAVGARAEPTHLSDSGGYQRPGEPVSG